MLDIMDAEDDCADRKYSKRYITSTRKKFFTKICPKNHSRNLPSLGGLRKAVFLKFKI